MIILKTSNFSALGLNNSSNKPIKNRTINTTGRMLGFDKDRNYDQDFNRLGRNQTTRQLTQGNLLRDEMNKLRTELNNGRRGKWLDTD